MKGSIFAILKVLGIEFNNKPKEDTRPRYKVEVFGHNHYLYTLNKPFLCPDVYYYKYTGSSLNSGRFKEVEACLENGAVLFRGFIAKQIT